MAIAVEIRRLVEERAGSRCEYCQCPSNFTSNPFAVEHINPRAGGGTDELENLAWSCQGCNGHKLTATTAEDPVIGGWVPLYHPRHQAWRTHFRWSMDELTVIGMTPTGRATIERLQLNRLSVINLRWALKVVGVHPPSE